MSLVVVSLKLALSSTAEAGLTLERGRSCFSDTDLRRGGREKEREGRRRKEEGEEGKRRERKEDDCSINYSTVIILYHACACDFPSCN